MIANDSRLVELYNEFIAECELVYPNASRRDLPTAEEFFEMLDISESDDDYDDDDEYDEYLDVSLYELLEMIGYQVIPSESGFKCIPRKTEYDA